MKKRNAVVLTAAALTATLFTGCTPSNGTAIITINGGKDKLTYGYVNFVCKFNQAMYDQMYVQTAGTDYWSRRQDSDSPTFETMIKRNIYSQIKHQYLTKKYASEVGVKLTSADKKKITQAAEKFIKGNSEKALDQMGATKEYAEDLMTYQTYYSKVQKKVEDEADVTVTDEEANQSTFTYALFSTQTDSSSSGSASTSSSSSSSAEMSDADKAELKKKAEKVASAEDFDKEAKAEGAETNTYSYTTAEKPSDDTVMNESVIQAAKKLKDGEVSDVIEVSDRGYYVIRMDKVHDASATKDKRNSLTEEKKEDAFNDKLSDWGKKVKFKRNNKLWKKIRFTDLFSSIEKASGDAQQ